VRGQVSFIFAYKEIIRSKPRLGGNNENKNDFCHIRIIGFLYGIDSG
jgi:hypothetical protein